MGHAISAHSENGTRSVALAGGLVVLAHLVTWGAASRLVVDFTYGNGFSDSDGPIGARLTVVLVVGAVLCLAGIAVSLAHLRRPLPTAALFVVPGVAVAAGLVATALSYHALLHDVRQPSVSWSPIGYWLTALPGVEVNRELGYLGAACSLLPLAASAGLAAFVRRNTSEAPKGTVTAAGLGLLLAGVEVGLAFAFHMPRWSMVWLGLAVAVCGGMLGLGAVSVANLARAPGAARKTFAVRTALTCWLAMGLGIGAMAIVVYRSDILVWLVAFSPGSPNTPVDVAHFEMLRAGALALVGLALLWTAPVLFAVRHAIGSWWRSSVRRDALAAAMVVVALCADPLTTRRFPHATIAPPANFTAARLDVGDVYDWSPLIVLERDAVTVAGVTFHDLYDPGLGKRLQQVLALHGVDALVAAIRSPTERVRLAPALLVGADTPIAHVAAFARALIQFGVSWVEPVGRAAGKPAGARSRILGIEDWLARDDNPWKLVGIGLADTVQQAQDRSGRGLTLTFESQQIVVSRHGLQLDRLPIPPGGHLDPASLRSMVDALKNHFPNDDTLFVRASSGSWQDLLDRLPSCMHRHRVVWLVQPR